MKKFLTILNILLLITLVTLTLYIFDIIEIPWLNRQPAADETPLIVDDNRQLNKVARKKDYEELMQKGDLYFEKEFYELAVDSYTKASNEEPTAIEPLLNIAEIHNIQLNYLQAKNLSLQILKKDQHNLQAKIILGKALIGLEDFSTAKNTLDSITSDNQTVQYYQGIMALYFGEYERGRVLLEKAAEQNDIQNVKEKAQNFIAALNEFDRYQGGQHNHLKVLLARSFAQAFQPHLAKELIWTVLKEQRDYRDAWIILGYSYLRLEQFTDAIDALEEAKRQDPENPTTLFYLGLAYSGNDEIDKAIEMLELARSNGYEPKIHVDQKLAELYFQKQDYENANELYEEVITLNSADLNYFIRPIWIYIDKLNEPHKAVKLAEKAKLHHPQDAMTFNLLGWAQVANRDFVNGKRNLEEALNLSKNFDAPYLNLGWMYELQGKNEDAKNYYKLAYEIGNGSSVADLAAQRYNDILQKQSEQSIMANIFN